MTWTGNRPSVWMPVVALTMVGLLILLLGPIAWWATPAKHLTGKDKADVRNTTRQTLLAAVGGLVVLTGAAFTARTYYLSRRGHITDRYTKAITQLASDKLTERLGGIYALEHVMLESETEHNTVVDVLAAFIRERSPITGSAATARPVEVDVLSGHAGLRDFVRPPTDVQAALTVIGRRPSREERGRIDLRRVDLQGADLRRARLQTVDLRGTQLQTAYLGEAQLQGALLGEAQLHGAFLRDAQLHHADLRGARLRDANLRGAQLQGVFLSMEQLAEVWLDEAQRRALRVVEPGQATDSTP